MDSTLDSAEVLMPFSRLLVFFRTPFGPEGQPLAELKIYEKICQLIDSLQKYYSDESDLIFIYSQVLNTP